jgi:hypothetical protein
MSIFQSDCGKYLLEDWLSFGEWHKATNDTFVRQVEPLTEKIFKISLNN